MHGTLAKAGKVKLFLLILIKLMELNFRWKNKPQKLIKWLENAKK